MLIRSAEELEGYSRGEEGRIEEVIKAIADSGARVVVGHQAFGEMALHFIEKHGMMAVKIPSKFDLRRFCRATGAGGSCAVRGVVGGSAGAEGGGRGAACDDVAGGPMLTVSTPPSHTLPCLP